MVTILTGFAVFWLLPDSPETAKWLSPREKEFLRYRLEQDTGTKEGRVNTTEKFELKYLIKDRLQDLGYRLHLLGINVRIFPTVLDV